MNVTKEALTLFLQSLPVGCHFSIVSFGTKYESLIYKKHGDVMQYNDFSLAFAKKEVDRFSANFGGTDILSPLNFAVKRLEKKFVGIEEKRIFVLTDGQVRNPDQIIKFARESNK